MASDGELENRLPPNSQDAERSVLGSIMRDNAMFADASQEISASDFYSDAHQRLWRIFAEIEATGKPIDLVTVADTVKARDWLTDIGGSGYLIDLWDSAPSTTNAAFHAKIVREKAMLRAVIRAGGELQRLGFEQGMDAEEIAARAGEVVFELSAGQRAKTVTWKDAVEEALKVLDRRSGKSGDGEYEEGMKTGWGRFDTLTGGFHRRELIVVGARPSIGKTLLALNIIDAVAAEHGRIFFASLEQGIVEIVHRMFSMKARVSSHNFRTGKFNEEQDVAITKTVDATKDYKITINPGSSQSLAQILSDSRRLKMQGGLDLVVVDYLGLLEGERRRHGTRVEEIGLLTRGMKRLAKDLDVAVILLAQLNRGIEGRVDKQPRLSDLRESGDIEQDADTVLMLHKPQAKDDKREIDDLHIQIEKQRNGPCGTIEMEHHKKIFLVKEKVVF